MAMAMLRVLQVTPGWLVPLVVLTVKVMRVMYAVTANGAAGDAGGDCRCRNGCWWS